MRTAIDYVDGLGLLSETIDAHRGPGPVVMLTDATPKFADDRNLIGLATDLLPDASVTVLGETGGRVLADEATVAAGVTAATDAGCLVTLGSGTITDLGKLASHKTGVPLVAVPTAASVNGYSDHLAVVLRAGAKRTVPAVSPVALVVDDRVLAGAPAAMGRAGLGETVGALVAPADWLLAAIIGADPSFDAEIVKSYHRPAADLMMIAPGIDRRNPEALADLFRLLTSAGLAMGMAGRTAPLSGTEHAISHLLDMVAGASHGLHGAQVGVAAVVAACLWEVALSTVDLEATSSIPEDRALAESLNVALSRLDPATVDECWSDYRAKPAQWRASSPGQRDLATIGEQAAVWLGKPVEMTAVLVAAGAPTRFSDLGIDADTARWAVANAHLLRSRFTILDLVLFAGGDVGGVVEDALERASEVGGGL